MASQKGQRLLMLGTAFSFVHLLDHLAEQELWFKLPPGSCALETGGYKGRSRSMPKAALHALIAERLGIPGRQIVCEYGMSELSSQAYDSAIALPLNLSSGMVRTRSAVSHSFRAKSGTRWNASLPSSGGKARQNIGGSFPGRHLVLTARVGMVRHVHQTAHRTGHKPGQSSPAGSPGEH
jgi:hypothetical protein